MRLARAMVIIRNTETKREMFGHRLIAKAELDEKTRHWIYRLDPDLRELYGDITHTLIDWTSAWRSKARIWPAGCSFTWRPMPGLSR